MTQYQRNEKITVHTDTMTGSGTAIGRVPDGRPVFVKGGAPNEDTEVRLTKIKRDFIEAEFIRAIKPSPDRVDAPFVPEALSGANWHYLSYAAQLAAKQDMTRDVLKSIGGFDNPPLLPIVSATNQWRYRNKVELTFGTNEQGHVALGFHKPGRFDEILPTNDIALFNEVGHDILTAIVKWARTENIPVYEPRRRTGFLRNLVIRRSEHTDSLAINLVTSAGELAKESLLTALRDIPLTGVMWSENGSFATIVRVDELHILSGTDRLTELFLNKPIEYGIDSFFQVNTLMAEKLAQSVLDTVGSLKPSVVVDGYAGVGGFGLFLADTDIKVTSIESHPASSQDAQANAKRLGVESTMTFVEATMEQYLAEHQLPGNAVLIIDPPRSGLHPKALKAITVSGLDHIVYVSCNPATLARDLKDMKLAYDLVSVQPYDLFPQTSHVENIAILRRRSV